MARKLKDKDLQKYGSRTSAVKSDMDKPTASTKGLDDAVSKIGAKTKQGMSDAGSFGSAFKAARSSGDKTFTWRGTSYTTKMGSDKPSAPAKRAAPAAKPAASKPAAAAPAKRTEAPRSAGPMKSGFKSAMGPSASSDFSNAKVPTYKSSTPKKRPLFGEDGIIAGYDSPATIAKKRAEGEAKAKAGNPFYKSYLSKPATSASKTPAPKPLKPSRPSVADVTRTDITGRKVELSPEKKRKLQEAINRGGTRMAKGGSIDGCAVRGKTKAR